ncbi:MAG: right-handed parallel beta-helix repeat-containing protein [Nanoarchaeota archaeon]|nr:right-handed parallel beta-helix repeat-containing protein [Nanoarchaeota archaeon]
MKKRLVFLRDRFRKKAQSAMEYLLTYGWAILVVLIVMTGLFYFGVFETKTVNNCFIESPFVCKDIIFKEGYVGVYVGSIDVKSATVNNIFINGEDCVNFYNGEIWVDGALGNDISDSSLNLLWVKCKINQNNLVVGSRASVEFDIEYTKKDGLVHNVGGRGSGVVEGGDSITGNVITGNIYYVNESGCDNSYNGSINYPWCEISYAADNDSIKPGDVIYVRSGVYEEFSITPINSGNESDYVIYSVYEGDDVLIKGDDTETGFNLNNKDYIVINGFKFEGFKEVIKLQGSSFNVISNNHMTNWKNFGMKINGEENFIKNNTLRDGFVNGGWYGIMLEGDNNTVLRNQLFNLSLDVDIPAIKIDGDDNKIFNNVIYDSSRGIDLSDDSFNNNVSNNIIESSIYTLVFSNAFFNDIDHNILYNKKMYYVDNTITQFVSNNIFQRDSLPSIKSLSDHQAVSGKNAHSSNMNPFFTDEESYDFRLNKLSWAVDAGRKLNLDYVGEQGEAIDIGVYEVEQNCDDSDSDGYYKDTYVELNNLCPGGRDCNDVDPDINPGEDEICDGYDNDCDGLIDEGNCPLVEVGGNDYYVSNYGEDYYNGLSPVYTTGLNGPWKNIKYALHVYNRKRLVAGDTLNIVEGEYREIRLGKDQWGTNNSVNSGNSLNNITIKNYNGGNVRIKGSTLVENEWSVYGGSIYNVTIPMRYYVPDMLFEDGVILSNDHDYGYDGFNMNKDDISEVDEPGEWFANRTVDGAQEDVNIYLWSTDSSDPTGNVIEASLDMGGFWIYNVQNYVFENLNFSQFGGTPILGVNISNSTVKDSSFTYTYTGVYFNHDYSGLCKPYEENMGYGYNKYINNYFIGNIHGGRIQDDGHHNLIEGNIFMAGERKLASAGIIVRGGKNIIKNNIFNYEENKDDLWARSGLILETGLSSDNVVYNNTLIHARLSVQGSSNNITDNIFYSPSEDTSWAFEPVIMESSFYTNPQNPCCYICNNYSEQRIHTNSTGNLFSNNLIYVWNPYSAFTLKYDIANNTIINNIIVSNYTLMSKIGVSNNDSEIDYNFYVWLNPYSNDSFYDEINNSLTDNYPGMNSSKDVNWDWRWNYNDVYRVDLRFWNNDLNRDINSGYTTNISKLFVNISVNNFTINNQNLICNQGKDGADIGPSWFC